MLGLDYAQVNPGALESGVAGGTQGWPVMQPDSGVCSSGGGDCIPNPGVLSYDDIAALNRIYPITAANLASLSGEGNHGGEHGFDSGNDHVQNGPGDAGG